MTIGGAFQRDTTALVYHRVPRCGQEVGRFRSSTLFQFRVDVEFGFGADAVFVHIGNVAAVITLKAFINAYVISNGLFPKK